MVKGEGTRPERERYEAIAERLVREHMGVVAAQMFGMPSLKADGKAFCGFSGGEMVFKLAGVAHARALELAGSRLFDPSAMGRPMKAWVVVPAALADEWEPLAGAALASLTGAA